MTTRAQRNINWIQDNLRIPDGKFIGQPFMLMPEQKDYIVRIYDNPEKTRMGIKSMARKNGKTAESAALLMLHFIGPESKQNAQQYSAARTRDQAGLVYDCARKIIEMNEEFKSLIRLVSSQKKMRCPMRGTEFKALSADAPGAMGLNPAFVIHDELGQVRGQVDKFYDAIESAMGAQEEPLSLIISTQAESDEDLLSILIDDGLAGHDPVSYTHLTLPTKRIV